MFKKIMASVGIGSASVDAVLLTDNLMPGMPFNVRINIKGGDVDQEVNGLKMAVATMAKQDGDEGSYYTPIVIAQWPVEFNQVVKAKEELALEVELNLPEETPITAIHGPRNDCRVWLETGLDIESGLDSSDKDYLEIHPTPVAATLINAMNELGYNLEKMDVEVGRATAGAYQSTINCYQEFEFRPSFGCGFGTQEVEATFITHNSMTGILMEKDRAFGGDSYSSFEMDVNTDDEAYMIASLQSHL
ncbi:sporulation protein [Neptuniibacter sp. QD37_11]|uniref:sporulation protein n=1 Tax=Neptuniibacter sp. QD37_11 TaxID=3398209 RepID=UPI0039F5C882